MSVLCRKYGLFPTAEGWRGRILLLESSEEKPSPEKYRRALRYLKGAGVSDSVSGILAGKPMDEAFDVEYRRALVEVVGDPSLPILCNLNVGHATLHHPLWRVGPCGCRRPEDHLWVGGYHAGKIP